MVLPSGPNGRVIEARDYEFKAVEGRGRGLFLTEDVKAGDTILLEEPAVIGPKQMSPLVGPWKGMRNNPQTYCIEHLSKVIILDKVRCFHR